MSAGWMGEARGRKGRSGLSDGAFSRHIYLIPIRRDGPRHTHILGPWGPARDERFSRLASRTWIQTRKSPLSRALMPAGAPSATRSTHLCSGQSHATAPPGRRAEVRMPCGWKARGTCSRYVFTKFPLGVCGRLRSRKDERNHDPEHHHEHTIPPAQRRPRLFVSSTSTCWVVVPRPFSPLIISASPLANSGASLPSPGRTTSINPTRHFSP